MLMTAGGMGIDVCVNYRYLVQGAVAAGLRIEFSIMPELTGLVIGKKGAHLNKVYEATGVSHIDVSDGLIRIVGPSMTAVTKAKEMLEFHQVQFVDSPSRVDERPYGLLSSVRLHCDGSTHVCVVDWTGGP